MSMEKLFKNAEKQDIINLAYTRQGFTLNKFEKSNNFIEMLKELGIRKSTFKVNLYKLIKKYPKLKNLTMSTLKTIFSNA